MAALEYAPLSVRVVVVVRSINFVLERYDEFG